MNDCEMGITASVGEVVGVSCECTIVSEPDCPCVDDDD